MRTDGKPDWSLFAERRAGGSRYFVAGSGPPLVLVHGLGGMASNWRLVAPALARDWRVIVPDLPGHGGSSRLAEAESVDPFARAVLAVVEVEDAAPAPWVGHSLGGLVGLRAAVLRPEAVTGLVLAAAAGISSATRVGEATVTVLGAVQPGRVIGRQAHRVSRSRLGRTVAFGWWGVADPAGFDPEMAEAFLLGPPQHTDTVSAGRALVASDPRVRSRTRAVPLSLSVGRARQLGAAEGRDGICAAVARATAHDRRLRASADRRATGRRRQRRARVRRGPRFGLAAQGHGYGTTMRTWRAKHALETELVGDADEADARVLDHLERLGCDPAEPRATQHYLYFAAKSSAEAVARALRTDGWSTRLEQSEGAWLVVATRSRTLTSELVHETRARLATLASLHGGVYDGWEAPDDISRFTQSQPRKESPPLLPLASGHSGTRRGAR